MEVHQRSAQLLLKRNLLPGTYVLNSNILVESLAQEVSFLPTLHFMGCFQFANCCDEWGTERADRVAVVPTGTRLSLESSESMF